MDWLKNRPGLQILLNGLIIVLGLIFMHYFDNGKQIEKEALKDIEILKIEKATYPYVDQQISKHSEYDQRQDEKIETMRLEWREDQKEIRSDQKEILKLLGSKQ